jgi:cytochrome o ubiquinol oxidase subunit III
MNEKVLAHHQDAADKTQFGFWVYLMTDCVLFASLFATYAVLRHNTAGGEGAEELFSLPFVLVETMLLLVSSLTAGISLLLLRAGMVKQTLALLGVTMALGAGFLAMELYEFAALVSEGNSWQRSGFLSAFFTLVATHGLHITVGLLWAATMAWGLLRYGVTPNLVRKYGLFVVFWHFLDVVWIFIFTIVYLLGALGV